MVVAGKMSRSGLTRNCVLRRLHNGRTEIQNFVAIFICVFAQVIE